MTDPPPAPLPTADLAAGAGPPLALSAPQAVLIPKGRSRRIRSAGPGLRYVSVHLRRHGLQTEDRLSRT